MFGVLVMDVNRGMCERVFGEVGDKGEMDELKVEGGFGWNLRGELELVLMVVWVEKGEWI